METLRTGFDERLSEVEAYLDFLTVLEVRAQDGPPKLEGAQHAISTQQQKILYSSVYLHLYNLVESTMSRCIEAVAHSAARASEWKPGDLSVELREEWVRVIARTHVTLEPRQRLQSAVALCEHLVSALPVAAFKIEKGHSGNWDDVAIEKISKRLGLALVVSEPVFGAVKRHLRDDLGPLALVKDLRNRLAHGSISFTECAENVTVADLIDLKEKAVNYLREVVERFIAYLSSYEFLLPARRPTSA